VLLRVRVDAIPAAVVVDGSVATNVGDRAGFDAAEEGFFLDGPYVWVKVPAGAASTITVE
jgi:hypothetical protein